MKLKVYECMLNTVRFFRRTVCKAAYKLQYYLECECWKIVVEKEKKNDKA